MDKSFFNKFSEETKAMLKDVSAQIKAYKIEMAELAATPADPNAAPSPTDMVEASLADGTSIKYTPDATGALGIGSDVVIVSPDGETPAPDGDLTLADGTVITIASGKVSEIETADASAVEPEGMKAEVKKVQERVTKIVEKFEAVEAENKKLRAELDSLKLKVGKQGAELNKANTLLVAFAEVPTEEAIEEPKTKKTNSRLDNVINAAKK